nr:RibD family protein [Turneriella parva]
MRLNMAMTLDGHVAHPTEAWNFGSSEDRRRMDRLREWADCLIVSRKTLEHDNMDLRVRTKPHSRSHPRPVIVLNSAEPLKAGLKVLQHSKIEGEVWISETAKSATLAEIWPDLTHPWQLNRYKDVRDIVASLYGRGFQKLLLEGGPSLNGRFFFHSLVDEFFLTLLPLLWGGKTTDRSVVSENSLPLERFRLRRAEKRGDEMFFRYVRRQRPTPKVKPVS